MSGDRVSKAAVIIGVVLALGYIAAGVVGWIADVGDNNRDMAIWIGFLIGGGALILLGLFVLTLPRLLAVVLVAIGAILGSLTTFWTMLTSILAITLIVLMVVSVRRGEVASAS